MSFYDKLVPEGYEVEETNERVERSEPLSFFTKGAAKRYIKRNPSTPLYHLRIERKGRWQWDVVAYHNLLHKGNDWSHVS